MAKIKEDKTKEKAPVVKINKQKLNKVEKFLEELVVLMGVNATFEIHKDKENNAIKVDIKSEEEQGLLIGKRGETLTSIQTLIGMMLKNEYGEWTRVVVNIGDWREKEQQYLENLATQTADRAIETEKPQELYNLNSGQRRIVHMVLSEVEGIVTESSGEGNQRFLIVSPKK